MDVAGKKAIVLGGTSGIGLATTRRLAGLGAEVVAVSRNPGRAGDLPVGVTTRACDTLDRDGLAALFAELAPFDILISAATGGDRAIGPFASMDMDGFEGSFRKVWGYANVVRIPGPHCYDFYGGAVFTAHNEAHPGTFYLTDFLARHFDALVWKGLGIAQHPELRPLYFGNYTHVLYLNQLPAHDEEARARAAAEKLGLTYVSAATGLDELRARIVPLVEACAARVMQSETPPCAG